MTLLKESAKESLRIFGQILSAAYARGDSTELKEESHQGGVI